MFRIGGSRAKVRQETGRRNNQTDGGHTGSGGQAKVRQITADKPGQISGCQTGGRQTKTNRQAADKRLPDRRRQRPDRRWTAEVRQQKAGGAGLFIGSRRQPLHSRQIIPICSARPLIWH